jgi:acyl carrier protein
MPSDVSARVRRVVADLFDLDPATVTDDSSPETIEAWDSLQHLNLIVALEQAFDMGFMPEEIQEMLSINEIVRTIGGKYAAQISPATHEQS